MTFQPLTNRSPDPTLQLQKWIKIADDGVPQGSIRSCKRHMRVCPEAVSQKYKIWIIFQSETRKYGFLHCPINHAVLHFLCQQEKESRGGQKNPELLPGFNKYLNYHCYSMVIFVVSCLPSASTTSR